MINLKEFLRRVEDLDREREEDENPTGTRAARYRRSNDVPPCDRRWAAAQYKQISNGSFGDVTAQLSEKELDLLKHITRQGIDVETSAAALALAAEVARKRRKATRDARTDRKRRVLVGARLPRETAQRVQQAAEAQGISVYRWCERAIAAALESQALP